MQTALHASPFNIDDAVTYGAWREEKLSDYPSHVEALLVQVTDPRRLSDAEHAALLQRCRKSNMAIYTSDIGPDPDKNVAMAMGAQFGLHRLDHNRGADEDAITSLQVSDSPGRGELIPYTNRPIHWHTDGYYNTLDRQVRGLLLHCVQRAAEGGENALMDHEMAYIALRDENPGWVAALMAPEAMTIPPHVVDGRELRPARSGPVFAIGAQGELHMRFTMRAHNIHWKDEPDVRAGVAFLGELLRSDAPAIFRATLQPGWGLLCNNVLHDRSGFNDDPAHPRLLYRARYYDRISGT